MAKNLFELGEVLNIFPIKKTITVCKVVLPSAYVKVKSIKNNQTLLSFSSKDICNIFNDYIDSKHIIIGHVSFHNNYQYVISSSFSVKVEEVLPKECKLIRLVLTAQLVDSFEYKVTEDLDSELPFEDNYIVSIIDNKVINSNN